MNTIQEQKITEADVVSFMRQAAAELSRKTNESYAQVQVSYNHNVSPLSELTRYLKGWGNIATAKRQFAELLGVEVAQEICAEVVEHERQISATAHKSETYDREALRLIDEAQAPDSDGGSNITPAEAKAIRNFTLKSAELDHNAAELATV